jgi:hypothetical protein
VATVAKGRIRVLDIIILSIAGVALVWFGLNLFLAQGQKDGDRQEFDTGQSVLIPMEAGDERIVYFKDGGDASFGVPPSAVSCRLAPPSDEVSTAEETGVDITPERTNHRESRFVDGWTSYDALFLFTTAVDGTHQMTCSRPDDVFVDTLDIEATLIVAKPASVTEWVDPKRAAAILFSTIALTGILWVISGYLAKRNEEFVTSSSQEWRAPTVSRNTGKTRAVAPVQSPSKPPPGGDGPPPSG